MVSVNYNGRLGNNLIQFLAGYLLSRKKGLMFSNRIGNINNLIKHDIEISGKIFTDLCEVNDENFISILEDERIGGKHFYLNGFFQTKGFLEKYEEVLKSVLNINYENFDKDTVFVHYRIGDIVNDRRMLPLEYYEEALSKINFTKGYISSDTINHDFCQKLVKKYNLIPVNLPELELINFAKNFNNIILSEGTFSWWMGFLSQAENIIYNKRNYYWHGDIFFNRWTNLSWDYEENTIYDIYRLKNYKPINLNK